jgi:hypothetical protein
LSSFIVSLTGVSKQVVASGQRIFFMGEYYPEGFPGYSALLFLIRTPVPLLLLIVLSVYFSLKHRRSRRAGIADLCIVTFILTYFLSVSFSRLQGGIRYLLPVYPFICVWVSDTLNVGFASKKANVVKAVTLSAIIFWYGVGTLAVSPHYLSYFNEFTAVSGRKVHKVSHDMDWGQDLKLLSAYMKQNNIPVVSLGYFGNADPSSYGVDYVEISRDEHETPGSKVYAVSVRNLNGLKWAAEKEPTAKAGYSIFIYDFRSK